MDGEPDRYAELLAPAWARASAEVGLVLMFGAVNDRRGGPTRDADPLGTSFIVVDQDVEGLSRAPGAHFLTYSVDGMATGAVFAHELRDVLEILAPPQLARPVDRGSALEPEKLE